MTRLRRIVPIVLAGAVAGAACGLSPASRDAVKAQQGAVITGPSGAVPAPAGDVGTGDTGTGDTGTGSTGTGTTPTTAATDAALPVTGGGGGGVAPVGGGGGTTAAPGQPTTGPRATASAGSTAPSGKASAAGGPCSTDGGNSTGVTKTTLNIGAHAPLTGTGTPFPNTSFQVGSKIYWQAAGHTVCGRKVSVDFRDDTYTPSGARAVCEPESRQDFLVIGLAGTDQIQSCATDPVLDGSGTPYLSGGVTTNGLTGLPNYFPVSLTYQQQGPLVVKAAQANGYATPAKVDSGHQWAIVTANTKNFDDATQGITAALDAAGITYKVLRVDQSGNYDAAATSQGQSLALKGYHTIFVDTAPGYFVFMTAGYYKQNPVGDAIWTGPGITFTELTVAQLACTATGSLINNKAYFLAPGPGLDHATPDFIAAAKAANNGKYDDIMWSLWGLSQSIYQMLTKTSAAGPLTRQSFIKNLSGSTIPNGIYSPLDYRSSHFGGTGAWLQRMTCSQNEPGQSQPGTWVTVGSSPYVL
ncbi:MAG TPA: hypothetical protein VHE83_08170 [Mycobacteriales bacterium]|nr:hypothetical protein [Mycobacteriales bacterium]